MHIFDAVPRDHVALRMRRPKDVGMQVRITLGLKIVKRRAAAHWVEDEAQGLLLRQCGVHFSKAICGARSSVSANVIMVGACAASGSSLFERK